MIDIQNNETNDIAKRELDGNKIVAIVQVRTTSKRLPNKALRLILGKPMIIHQLDRVSKCLYIDHLIVATSDHSTDDELTKVCKDFGYNVSRGSLHNVVDRIWCAVEKIDFGHLVRLTGDCPLSDPKIIDRVIVEHLKEGADYSSNTIIPTFPDGLDVEVLTKKTFRRIVDGAFKPSHFEHVTSFVSENENDFFIHQVLLKSDLSSLRWTVDEPVDLELITKIYEKLYLQKCNFSMDDVLELIQCWSSKLPDNSHIPRNEGYAKSVREERQTSNF